MADSLVVAGQVELLGGGVASTHPLCAGAIFYLGRDFDLSSPPPTGGEIETMIAGDSDSGHRQITLPVVVRVPSTGDNDADRNTLAGAREVLLSAVSADEWPLTWTRQGGAAMVLDCFEADAAAVEYSVTRDKALVSLFSVSFVSLAYGRSDDQEVITFPAPSQAWTPPPAPVTLDAYASVSSADDPTTWSQSNQTVITGEKSAAWSRVWRDSPVYDHTITSADITGRAKLSFWLGLATTTSQWATWHKGLVSFSVTLRDSGGGTLTAGTFKRRCQASQIQGKPHWQLITMPLPQVTSGFNYAAVTSYVIQVWNHWDSKTASRTLQAGAFLNHLQVSAAATGTPAARGAFYQLPGVEGSAPAPVTIQAAPGPGSLPTVVTFTTAGSKNWTAPAGVSLVDKEECWGAGAGSGGAGGGYAGQGGGSGEYSAEFNIPVVPLTVYHPVVGAGGAFGSAPSGDGTNGGDTTGGLPTAVTAHGGTRGRGGTATQSLGQGGKGSVNYLHYPGGSGAPHDMGPGSDRRRAGGGGASAAPSGAGNSASGRSGGTALDEGGPGGDGGGPFTTPSPAGQSPASGPGGGAGGGGIRDSDGLQGNGNNGIDGKVRITYGTPAVVPLSSLLLHSPGRDAPEALNPLIAVGNGADPPDGREYTPAAVGTLNARYDGTYTCYLIASAWNSPGSARNLTVTFRQYPYSGGTAVSQALTVTGLVPNSDVTNGYVDMGVITLPLSELPPGNITDAYFTVGVTSSNASDRFYDVIMLDLAGRTVLLNVPGTSVFKNVWVDEPDHDRDYGGVFGSDADRDRAVSAFRYLERISGAPFAVAPALNNRLFTYAAQGCPGIQVYYLPRWRIDRLV